MDRDTETGNAMDCDASNMHYNPFPPRPPDDDLSCCPLNSHATKVALTTEEIQLHEAELARDEVHQRIAQNQLACTRNKFASSFSGTVRSTKNLTVPESPMMLTKSRNGVKQVPESGFKPSEEPQENCKIKLSLTVSKPFELKTESRAKSRDLSVSNCNRNGQSEVDMPVAEAIYRMEHAVPSRFHTLPTGSKPPFEQHKFHGKLTVPKSPAMHDSSRPIKVKGFLEKEEAMIEDSKKHQFKARPLNLQMLESGGMYGVPQVKTRMTTEVAPFSFQACLDQPREKSKLLTSDDIEMKKKFKARSIPRNHSKAPKTYKPTKQKLNSTSSQSRSMSAATTRLHPRSGQSTLTARQLSTKGKRKNSSVEKNKGKEAKSPTGPRPLTSPKPFNLATEKRGQLYQEKYTQHLAHQQQSEEKAVNFRARKMPDFSNGPDFIPQLEESELTDFQVFNLKGLDLHQKASAEFESKMAAEREAAKQMSEMRARPLPASTFGASFKVKRPSRPPLKTKDINLASSVRAAERKMYDSKNKQRIASEEHLKRLQWKETERQNLSELEKLRRIPIEEGGMKFVAQPAKNARPFQPAPCNTELTVPLTPKMMRRG